MKMSNSASPEPCDECGAEPDDEHASWCLAPQLAAEEEDDIVIPPPNS